MKPITNIGRINNVLYTLTSILVHSTKMINIKYCRSMNGTFIFIGYQNSDVYNKNISYKKIYIICKLYISISIYI